MSTKGPDDSKIIDTNQLLPEERFNVLLLLLANGLPQCEMTDEFILISKKKGGPWGAHTSIQDFDRMKEILSNMADEKPRTSEVRTLNMANYSVAAQKGGTKQ